MGWQWVAGSGPDAAPYFRIFNPAAQAERFDPGGGYRRTFLAEGQATPPATAREFFAAVPRAWGLSPDAPYPAPMVDLAAARARALRAYAGRDRATAE
jgi:deoxyribodipyrimidine photo-lyase